MTVYSTHRRLSSARAKAENGKLPSFKKWSRESRFWALRLSLFEMASGMKYEAVVAFQKSEGAYGFDPLDEIGAEDRAKVEIDECRAHGIDMSDHVLDHWHYWLHFPTVLQQVLGLDVEEMQQQIARFDAELREAVMALDAKVRQQQRELKLARLAAQRETEEREAHLARLLENPPCPYRMEAQIIPAKGKVARMFDGKPLLKLTLQLRYEDLRGHHELVHPLMTGIWKVFQHLSIDNGIFVNHDKGVFSVTTDNMLNVDAFLSDYSRDIERVLDLDPDLIGPLSASKSAKVLGISVHDLRELSSVGEIHPITEVTITSGRLEGTSFMGYAVKEVLALKEVLEAARHRVPEKSGRK